jgi:TfoX/Sxy family transcriptional regulator of competence genes
MAYEEAHAARFRQAIEGIDGTSEKRMMGGVCFLVNGNMIGGVGQSKEGEGRFLFRVGKTNVEAAEKLPGGDPLIQGGRRMSGFYFVSERQCDDALFERWLSLSLGHALKLPPK